MVAGAPWILVPTDDWFPGAGNDDGAIMRAHRPHHLHDAVMGKIATFGELINRVFKNWLSDHCPMTVSNSLYNRPVQSLTRSDEVQARLVV